MQIVVTSIKVKMLADRMIMYILSLSNRS